MSYAITGGADRDKFKIDTRTGVVTFTSKSDHDRPRDADRNNTYDIEVTATATSDDGEHTRTATQDVAIRLINVNEATTGILKVTDEADRIVFDMVVTNTTLHTREVIPIADEDGIWRKTFIWRDGAGNKVGEGSSFTPTSAGTYRAIAIVIDSDYNRKEIISQTVEVTAPVPAVNIAPTLTITRPEQPVVITETTGGAVTGRIDTGIAVAAHDPEGDLQSLIIRSQQGGNWQIDDRFEVRNGKLFVKAGKTLDYESLDNPNGEITLRITATDAAGNNVHRTTTVRLTNENDPTIVNSLSIDGLVNGSVMAGTALTALVDATDPDVASLEYAYVWTSDFDKEPLSSSQSFTPTQPGTYRLAVMAIDRTFNSF